MQTFTDRTGRRWTLELTTNAAKRVRNLCSVNLLDVLDRPDTLRSLADDPILFVDVLYALCRPEADAAGITDEQFGEAFDGQAIENATEAFMGALVNFFQGARKATLQKIVDRAQKTQTHQETALMRAVNEGKIDEALDKVLPIVSPSSTRSEAPPESTPAPSP